MRRIKLVIPKGRIHDGVVRLLAEAGFTLRENDRHYVPQVNDPELQVKIMKPQNIAQLVELGSHDCGFTGLDWIVETGAQVEEVIDLGLDPVSIVAAVPAAMKKTELRRRRIVVASEYERISRQFLEEQGYNFILLRTYGATEAFPPEDADMIIDNTASGQTLRQHGLRVVATIMQSSTRFIANPQALRDERKREKIEELATLFEAVRNARERVMLEMNVPAEKLEAVVRLLPCMRAPTVAQLYGEQGYAVKAAVRRSETIRLIPMLKKLGATDILEYEFRKVIV
ncbi:MAG: ATP phosphoribosyltransferase [candidate division KSB1 bacterium]|nr:ATP phosphoribosyltransferase [candidate division KSB1 bacterium]MDZ7385491.1 ATP phosphoribosyltransferase [candidate division KSB1 bacterium]MDZ7393282.1 ATP phosphoribosyltransferase [candidate division KSB1 bacterium]